MGIRFDPKTIALGGVATGNIKAIDALIVAGSMINNGCMPILIDNPAKMGNIISIVAVLDVSSVKNVISIKKDGEMKLH